MRNDDARWWRAVGQASTVGFVLVVSIAIGYFFGSWLDSALGTGPWLMLVFTVLGAAAGFIEMFRIVSSISRDE